MTDAALAVSALAVGWTALRLRRRRLYRRLGELQSQLEPQAAAIRLPWPTPVPDFERRLAVLPDALPADLFTCLRRQALALAASERSYLPGHKQGGKGYRLFRPARVMDLTIEPLQPAGQYRRPGHSVRSPGRLEPGSAQHSRLQIQADSGH